MSRFRPRLGCVLAMIAGLATVALVVLVLLDRAAEAVDRRLNAVGPAPSISEDEATEALHTTLVIADMHADSLLWNRDLLRRSRRGHVDVPRLVEGNIALQVFSAVTRVPGGPRYQTGWDRCTPLILAQRWPPRTWRSLTERAVYQARKLHEFAAESNGRLSVVLTRADLRSHLRRRKTDPGLTAALLAIEGLHAIEGHIRNLDRLFEAGFRMMGLSHFHDNEVAGSAHGGRREGLTRLGRQTIARMEELGIVVDLSHAAPRAIEETLDIVGGPVVVSHTGVKATCDSPRNLSDRHIRRIAEVGGVIGIGFFDWAVCDTDPKAIVRAIRHVRDTVGIEHVGLGSDFDGAVRIAFDASGMAHVTNALLEDGFTEAEIRNVMGENVIRVLERSLRDR